MDEEFPVSVEDRVVEAAVRALVGAGPLTLLERPDERVRNAKSIDYRIRCALGVVCVEHTKVHAFPRERRVQEQAASHVREPLREALAARLPDGGSVLVEVPVWPSMRYGGEDIDALANAVEESVAAHGFVCGRQRLTIAPKKGPEFEVVLHRYPAQPSSGRKVLVHGVLRTDEAGHDLLRAELARALSEKAPKLDEARRAQPEPALPSLLVLEHERPLIDTEDLRALIVDQVRVQGVPGPDLVAAVEVVQTPPEGIEPTVAYLHSLHPDIPTLSSDDVALPHFWVALFDLRDLASSG